MADVAETSTWEAGVYQFETTDLIQGGASGVDNLPHKQLGNRTLWLYDNKVGAAGDWTMSGNYLITGSATISNNNPLGVADSGGTRRNLLMLNNVNDAYFGDIGNVLSRDAYVVAGRVIYARVNGVNKLSVDSSGPALVSALSGSDDSLKLVSSSWVRAYAAPLASPGLTGTPTAPTAAADTNTTQLATTAYVLGQRSTTTPLVDGSAAVGTSLKWARADHVHPTDTTRAPLSSPALTGTPTTTTPGANDDSTRIANTAWVQDLVAAATSDESLTQNGYKRIGGFIVQWGRNTTTANPTSVSFPLQFPNACFVVLTNTRRNTTFFQAVSVWNETINGFDSYHDAAGYSFNWVAIGY